LVTADTRRPGAAPEPAAGSRADPRYFHAALAGGDVTTRGSGECSLGHRIQRGAGRPDDGIFAQWRWDGDTLIASNDRYGMHPLYFSAEGGSIWLSPSIVTLVREGAPTGLDHAALAVFLRLGFFLDDDTPFRRIKALPPDARLSWRRGQLDLAGGRVLRRAAAIGRIEALDGYIELFRQSMRRRAPQRGDVAVPLSGGRDSRHILLELHEQGHRPELCVTARLYPPWNDEDARVAASVAAALGLPHVVLEQGERFDAELQKNVATSFCAEEHSWALVLADFLRRRAGTVYDGIGGDVLSAGLFLTARRIALYEAGRLTELAEHLVRRHTPVLGHLLQSDVRQRVARAEAVERVTAELARHREAANPIGSFYFWNRTRRAIALLPFALLGAAGTVYAPYLDHDLWDFLAALPRDLVRDWQLHTDAIRRAYPRFRDLPFEDKTAPGTSRWAHEREFLERLRGYARTRRSRAPPLTRAAGCILSIASSMQRFADISRYFHPRLALYLLQLEGLAANSDAVA
jgi:asparagine synthase (glutamine-hydrolysing)